MGRFGIGVRVQYREYVGEVIGKPLKRYRTVKFDSGFTAPQVMFKDWLAVEADAGPAVDSTSPDKREIVFTRGDGPKFKVGDRVRVVRHINWHGSPIKMSIPVGTVTTISATTDVLAAEGLDAFILAASDGNFYTAANLELAHFAVGDRVNLIGTIESKASGPECYWVDLGEDVLGTVCANASTLTDA